MYIDDRVWDGVVLTKVLLGQAGVVHCHSQSHLDGCVALHHALVWAKATLLAVSVARFVLEGKLPATEAFPVSGDLAIVETLFEPAVVFLSTVALEALGVSVLVDIVLVIQLRLRVPRLPLVVHAEKHFVPLLRQRTLLISEVRLQKLLWNWHLRWWWTHHDVVTYALEGFVWLHLLCWLRLMLLLPTGMIIRAVTPYMTGGLHGAVLRCGPATQETVG
jgi:hypothetical protein